MYELAYHLKSSLEESECRERVVAVESLLTKDGASIISSREPKKIHLSYPLAHSHEAYFCTVDFTGSPDTLDKISGQMKLQEEILRFLIIKKPEGKELRTFGDQRSRKTRMMHASVQAGAEKIKKEITPAEEKEMEKKLEDVLGKI